MITFLRRLAPLLTPDQRRKAIAGTGLAVVLALLDALGVVAVLPLLQLATGDTAEDGLTGELAERFGTDTTGQLAVRLAIIAVTAFVLKGVLALWLLSSNLSNALAAERTMAEHLIRGYLTMPLQFHLDRNSAELQTTLTDSLRRVYQEAFAVAIPAVADAVVVLGIGLVATAIAPLEAVIAAVWLGLIVASYRAVSERRTKASSVELVAEHERSTRLIRQSLASIREITISGRAETFVDEIDEVRDRAAVRLRTISLADQLPRYFLEIGLLFGASVVAAASFATRPADEALPVLGMFVAAGLRVLPSIARIINGHAKAAVAEVHVGRIEDDLARVDDHRAVSERDRSPLAPGEPFEQLEVHEVAFAYPGRAPVLAGTTLTVRRGQVVGIVGPSGVGKSTLLGILLGLLDPTAGSVTVNGELLADRRRSWQHRVGYVPQAVAVLDTTVRANVAFGVPEGEADDDAVRTALEAAELWDAVAALPAGLDTVVGEDGSSLSGGQRQRLGIARALYDTPEVLVLDEATSALDHATETALLATLDRLRGELTLVIVTHRTSTVATADLVVELQAPS